MARSVAFVAALGAALAVAAPAHASAPRYILLSGPGLSRPVVLANWAENGYLLSALVNAPRATGDAIRERALRPRLHFGLFWAWGGKGRPKWPSQADQHAWFYPAHGSRPPMIDIWLHGARGFRLLPTFVLKVLGRHGVPTRL